MSQLTSTNNTNVAKQIPLAKQISAYVEKCNTSFNTPAKIVQMDRSWSLSRWSMTHKSLITTIIIKEVASCVNFFMVKSPYEGEGSEEQLQELVDLIMSGYPDIKLSDVKLIFKKAKLGEYGEIYNRLDGPTILRWFKKYYEIRLEHWQDYKEQSIQRQKDLEKDTSKTADKEGLKKLAEAYKKMAILHRQKKQHKAEQKIKYSSLENYCQRNDINTKTFMENLDAEIYQYIYREGIEDEKLIDQIYTWKRLQKLHELNKSL